MRKRFTFFLAICLWFLSVSVAAQEPADVVIRGGRVLDPASNTDAVMDVAIQGGRIVALGKRAAKMQGTREIDATGLVVAPGFIDLLARLTPNQESQYYKVTDGVTTVLNMHGGPVDHLQYKERFAGGSLIHYGSTVGHGSLRRAVGITDSRAAATPEQIKQMQRLAAKAIHDGAAGIGFGVNYVPGASHDEVLALFEVAAEHGVPCHLHVRFKGSVPPGTIVAAVSEVIANAAVTGASAQVVHLASSGVGSMEKALEMIRGARARGIDVAADVYPYLANSTNLASALYDSGWEERFGGITYGDIELVETGERLTKESFEQYRKSGASIITHFIPEDELIMALRDPNVMVASDGIIRRGKGHPRGAGSFSRLLGYWVREKKVLSLMEALRKITVQAAQRLEKSVPAMRRKGRIQVGADADITIFDPETIRDRATYQKSAQTSVGIHYVFVVGQVVVEKGALVESVKPGNLLHHD